MKVSQKFNETARERKNMYFCNNKGNRPIDVNYFADLENMPFSCHFTV